MTKEKPFQLEWPYGCGASYEVRREFEEMHFANKAKRMAADHRTKEVENLRKRVATLERALKAMPDVLAKTLVKWAKTAGFMEYQGTYDETRVYRRGAAVTDHGAVWIAVANTKKGSRPGKAPEWRLCAKGDGNR